MGKREAREVARRFVIVSLRNDHSADLPDFITQRLDYSDLPEAAEELRRIADRIERTVRKDPTP